MKLQRSIGVLALAGAAMTLAIGAAAPATTTAAPANCSGSKSDTWLNVVVENVRSGDGQIAVTLYADNASKFLAKRGSLYVGRVPAKAGATRMCLHLPKTGVYALAVYHDIDGDRSFDRTGLGLPAEGYGFSNNASTLAGLPTFASVRLNIPRNNMTTRIRLKYP